MTKNDIKLFNSDDFTMWMCFEKFNDSEKTKTRLFREYKKKLLKEKLQRFFIYKIIFPLNDLLEKLNIIKILNYTHIQ